MLIFRHDSASVRKAHNLGRNHLQFVKEYYQKLGFDKTQSVLDSITQDYQNRALQEQANPFAPAGLPGLPGFGGGTPAITSFSYFTARPGLPMGGFGQPMLPPNAFGPPPVPGMPLPPPPGMPLPGQQNGSLPGMLPPGGFQPPMGVTGPPVMPPSAGGRVGP